MQSSSQPKVATATLSTKGLKQCSIKSTRRNVLNRSLNSNDDLNVQNLSKLLMSNQRSKFNNSSNHMMEISFQSQSQQVNTMKSKTFSRNIPTIPVSSKAPSTNLAKSHISGIKKQRQALNENHGNLMNIQSYGPDANAEANSEGDEYEAYLSSKM